MIPITRVHSGEESFHLERENCGSALRALTKKKVLQEVVVNYVFFHASDARRTFAGGSQASETATTTELAAKTSGEVLHEVRGRSVLEAKL